MLEKEAELLDLKMEMHSEMQEMLILNQGMQPTDSFLKRESFLKLDVQLTK
jgi:hypothetical protein